MYCELSRSTCQVIVFGIPRSPGSAWLPSVALASLCPEGTSLGHLERSTTGMAEATIKNHAAVIWVTHLLPASGNQPQHRRASPKAWGSGA
jgi:hypothetical protein